MKEKQEIILKYLREGKSQRQICRETGIARETIRKYTKAYEKKLRELKLEKDDIKKIDLIEDLVEVPKYTSSPRTKKAVTKEVVERLKFFLKENEQKRLRGLSKQQMKKIDIHEALVEEGFNVSYSSVVSAINSIERKCKEAYIRQEYKPGDVVEFDFGVVKLETEGGALREYQLAVFTSAYSNYRWARLFPKQDTFCFLEAHALFFNHIKGAYGTLVYDNTKVAVRRFVGHKEKEATEALLKLSLYYKFNFRFCNAYRGNEKGHVERSVEYIRRKAFSRNIIFTSLEEANDHLEKVLKVINTKKMHSCNKSARELFREEKEFLLPEMPMYETARIQDCRVNKYSVIMIDSCYYSVPDSFVGTMVRCKIYSSRILIYNNGEKIGEHKKISGLNKWSVDIEHYIYTLMRKPKALVNSTVFSKLNHRLKDIYTTYFANEERDFISLIQLVGVYGLSRVECAIEEVKNICPTNISIDKIEFICARRDDEGVIYLRDYNSDIVQNSIGMLEDFNNLLN